MENQTTPANNAMPRRVSQVLLTGARRLLAAGIESGRLDAELLLGHVLGMSREQLVIGASMPLSQEQWQSYESILLRRLDAEPTAYITGRQEFWSKDFRVTPDVLIPRPETECLVEIALKLAAGLARAAADSRSRYRQRRDRDRSSGRTAESRRFSQPTSLTPP